MKSTGQPGMLWRVAVVLLGLLALLLAYYWVHKPLDLALALALGGAFVDLLTVAVLFAIAGGVGRLLLALARLGPLSPGERVALAALLGLGLISLAALVLGLLGLFRGLLMWSALVLVAAVVRGSVRAWLGDVLYTLRHLPLASGWSRLLAGFAAAFLVLALVRALAPPHAWDAMTYHLVAPYRYLADGRIAAYPENVFMGFPQLVEVLYALAMSLFARDTVPAVVHLGFGVLGLLALAATARRCAPPPAAWAVVVLPLSAYSFWLLLGIPYVDLAIFAYSAAAFAALLRWRGASVDRWLLVAGLFGGFAFGAKYTAVGLLLALGVYVAWYGRNRVLRRLLWLGMPVFIVALPWFVKGALLYGNPVYPFFFDGANWDSVRAATFSTAGRGLLASSEAWQLAVLPLAATVLGVDKGPGFAFTAGPWLLAAPLLLIPGWRWLSVSERRLASGAMLLAVPLLLFWLGMAALSGIGMQTRLAMPLLPLAALLGGLALHSLARWPEKPLHIAFIVHAVFIITLLLGLAQVARDTLEDGAPGYLFALTGREAYLDQNLQAHAGAMRALADLPPGSRVRLLWEPRSYYCPPAVRCLPDILLDHWPHPLIQGASPEQILDSWRDAGDDYVLLWHAGFDHNRDDTRFAAYNARFPDAIRGRLSPVWTDGLRYTLYTWTLPPGL